MRSDDSLSRYIQKEVGRRLVKHHRELCGVKFSNVEEHPGEWHSWYISQPMLAAIERAQIENELRLPIFENPYTTKTGYVTWRGKKHKIWWAIDNWGKLAWRNQGQPKNDVEAEPDPGKKLTSLYKQYRIRPITDEDLTVWMTEKILD